MKIRILPICAAIFCMFAVCSMPAYAAETVPVAPHTFLGTVTVNGAPAQAGTVVEVRGANVTMLEGNPYTLTQAGVIGGSGFDPKLLVQGDIAPGTPLEFYVNGVKARVYNIATSGPWQDSFPFESLGLTELSIWVGSGDPVVVTTAVTTVVTTQTTAYYQGGGGGGSSGGGGGSPSGSTVVYGTTTPITTTTSAGSQATQTQGAGTAAATTQGTQPAVTTAGTPAATGTSSPTGTTGTAAAGTPLGIEIPVIALSVTACAAGYLAASKR